MAFRLWLLRGLPALSASAAATAGACGSFMPAAAALHTARCEQEQPAAAVQEQPSKAAQAEEEAAGFLQRARDALLSGEDLQRWQSVASSIQDCMQHVGPWGLGDFAFGLRAVAKQQAEEGVEDAIHGKPVTDRKKLRELLEDCRIADAVYEDTPEQFAEKTVLERDNILQFEHEADHFRAAYSIALLPDSKEVLLVIRGTSSLKEVLTDLAGHMVDFALGGHTHNGMLQCARWLLDNEADKLAQLLDERPDYRLKVLGHSLGAGTASLFSIMAHNDEQLAAKLRTDSLQCVTFATPPVVTRDIAVACEGYVTTVVHQDDLVPRASLAQFEDLRKAIIATNWAEKLKAEIGAQKLAELTEHTGRSIGEAWTKVGGVGAVKKVGDVWNEAAASDAVKAVGDVLDVAKVKLSTGLPAVGGTDKAVEYDMEQADEADKSAELHGSEREEPESATRTRQKASKAAETAKQHGSPGGEEEEKALEEAAAPTDIPRLFAPGRLLYLSQQGEGSDQRYILVEARDPDDRFEKIVISGRMIPDHLCTGYIAALENIVDGGAS